MAQAQYATAFDDRIVKVGIEINGKIHEYGGDNPSYDLAITAKGVKFDNAIMNEFTVTIANLNPQDQNFILTQVSPYNPAFAAANFTGPRLYVYAGRKSYGVNQIFVGDIIRCGVSQPPDVVLQIQARTGQYDTGKIATNTFGPKAQLSAIAASIASSMDLSLEFTATDKLVANYAYTGPITKQIQKLQEVGGVDAFQDDKTLVVKNKDAPRGSEIILISEQTGMIGIPTMDIQGVTVKYLMDNRSQLGRMIRVVSKQYPTVNADYVIYKLGTDIANRDTPFYWIAEAKRRISQQ